jgi:hypothetical protein
VDATPSRRLETINPKEHAMTTTPIITRAELISILEVRCRSGAFAVTLETRTVPTMRKTGNPYAGDCFKLATINVFLNTIYGNAVNRQRVREGAVADFEAQPRKWGERIAGTCFVQHKGALYVEAKLERRIACSYETAAGQPISAESLAPFLPDRADAGEAHGVERAIILCDYKVENIVGVTLCGQHYSVTVDVEEKACN